MRKLRINMVEDDAIMSTLLAEVPASMDRSVCAITASKADAMGAAVYHRPDFMVVDAHPREESGIAAMRTISRERAIPYPFVSGASIKLDKPGAEVLRKPFREPELVEAVGRALSRADAAISESA